MNASPLLCVPLLAVALSSAPQRYSSGVELVNVDALVTNGRTPLAGLTASDFELLDNGVPRFGAVHMTWGTINEWTANAAYNKLAN